MRVREPLKQPWGQIKPLGDRERELSRQEKFEYDIRVVSATELSCSGWKPQKTANLLVHPSQLSIGEPQIAVRQDEIFSKVKPGGVTTDLNGRRIQEH